MPEPGTPEAPAGGGIAQPPPTEADVTLTAETQEFLGGLERLRLPPLHTMTPVEARAMREAAARLAPALEPEPVATVDDRTLPGPGGELHVRLYTPSGWGAADGSLIYFHGGGWVLGDLDTHDASCRGLANASGLRVMAVQYRLAPEFPHPAALDDGWAAMSWLADESRGPLFLGGDSAGGHIATVLAARTRIAGPCLAGQLLVYPVTDLSRLDTGSYLQFADGYWLTRAAMQWFRRHYVPAGVDLADPDVSPLLRTDLTGMPPAAIIAAGCDVLRDEGAAYAERLSSAGCDVRYARYEGVIHGFFALPALIPEGRRAIEEAGAALAALARAAA